MWCWQSDRRFQLLEEKLNVIDGKLNQLLLHAGLEYRRWEKQMAWMDDLKDVVAEQTSVVAGVKAAFDGLSARLDEELAKDDVDLGKVQEISDAIKANTAAMAEAVKVGTAAEKEPESAVFGDKLETVYPEDDGQPVEGTVPSYAEAVEPAPAEEPAPDEEAPQ